MPTYHYRCPSCGHEFEEFQAISDKPIEQCPKCHKETRRVISGGAGLIFKGSGFYITDYKNKSRPSDSTDSSSKDSSTSSSKSDSAKSSGSSGGNGNSQPKSDSGSKDK